MENDDEDGGFYKRWWVRLGLACCRVPLLLVAGLLMLIGVAALLLRKAAVRVGRKRRLEDEKNARDYT